LFILPASPCALALIISPSFLPLPYSERPPLATTQCRPTPFPLVPLLPHRPCHHRYCSKRARYETRSTRRRLRHSLPRASTPMPHAFPSPFHLRLAAPSSKRAVNATNTHVTTLKWRLMDRKLLPTGPSKMTRCALGRRVPSDIGKLSPSHWQITSWWRALSVDPLQPYRSQGAAIANENAAVINIGALFSYVSSLSQILALLEAYQDLRCAFTPSHPTLFHSCDHRMLPPSSTNTKKRLPRATTMRCAPRWRPSSMARRSIPGRESERVGGRDEEPGAV
jgi:hypothetical protein